MATSAPALTVEGVKVREHTIGAAVPGAWNLWSAGEAGDFFSMPEAGRCAVRATVRGTPAGGEWPVMQVWADDRTLGTVTVTNAVDAVYEFPFDAAKGTHRVVVTFLNDAVIGNEDRNLYLISLAVEPATAGGPAVTAGDAESWRRERFEREGALERKALVEAAQSIEKVRKADGAVRVVDADGKPVAGAEVTVELARHEFLFGCNIFGFDRQKDAAKNDLYRQRFRDLFNYATVGFYWRSFEWERGKPQYDYMDRVVAWCAANGIRVKGHPLLWDHEAGVPPWRSVEQTDVDVQEKRVREIVGRYKGRIEFWEVVNEPAHVKRIRIDAPYRWAREADPSAHLIVNDYYVMANGFPPFRRMLTEAISNNVPFDGVGIQAHEPDNFRFPLHRAKAILDDYAALGKALHITEFTPASNGEPVTGSHVGGVWDEARQAECAENFYRLCFGHPAVMAITWWDLGDGGSWRKGGGLLRPDLSPKPAYEALRKLIRGEWATKAAGVTDRDGRFTFHGFLGDYRVVVRRGAREAVGALRLERKGGGDASIRLE